MTATAPCTRCDHVVKGKDRASAARYLATHLARHHGIGAHPAPCHHQNTHTHGTTSCYNRDGCRCIDCWRARNAGQNEWRRLKAYGRYPDYWVPAAPAREHVQRLRALGIGLDRITELAGVPAACMKFLVYGMPASGRGPAQKLRPKNAAAILAVPLDPALSMRRDPTGTRRRVQALIAQGHSGRSIARASGVAPAVVQRLVSPNSGLEFVEPSTADRIRDLYEDWWDTRPAGHVADRNREHARARGYVPPMCWDDETIDDPAAEPAVVFTKRRRTRPADEIVEDLDWLVRTGTAPHEAVARLGMTRSGIEQAAYRAGRPDLARWVHRKESA